MTTTHRRGAIRLAAAAPLLLAGCGGVLEARKDAPPSEYRLMANPVFPDDLPRADWVLVVTEPEAAGALESDRMVIMQQGRIDRVADVTWSDRPSAMLQFAMVQAFQASGRLKGVGTERDDLPSRYMLQSTLDTFQLEPGGRGAGGSGWPQCPAAAAAGARGRGIEGVRPAGTRGRALERGRRRRLRRRRHRAAGGAGPLDAARRPPLTPAQTRAVIGTWTASRPSG